jgi:predicted HTH transcriptional regulator
MRVLSFLVDVGGGGGRWSGTERQNNVNAVIGLLQQFFEPRNSDDPALDSWVTRFENILIQSFTEQDLYEFKQGFHRLGGDEEFDGGVFNKCIETLCAMANKGPGAVGYILIGICDKESDSARIASLYNVTATRFRNFHITGIGHEAERFHSNLDVYLRQILDKIKQQPIQAWVKDCIAREIRVVRYFDKAILVLKLAAGKEPTFYNNVHSVRKGATNQVQSPEDMSALFRRFFLS